MKKIVQILLISAFIFIPLSTYAQLDDIDGYDYTEQIDQFYSNITINKDSSVLIVEHITYNFNDLERHGIYRTIPYVYERNGTKYKLRINVQSVTDENGYPIPYTISKILGDLEIKIGDADLLVSGIKNYVIEYKVDRAINYFDNYDEFFWNVTGNEWEINIDSAGVILTLPENVSESELKTACYTGIYGSTDQNCYTVSVDSSTMEFLAEDKLFAYEGLTVVFGWPKNIITPPDSLQELKWFLADNWPLFFPVIVFLGLFFIWYARGRDPKLHQAMIPIYEAPNKMIVGELGTVIDEKVDTKDISATIIQLAIKGFLKIKEIDIKKIFSLSKDYELIKLKESDRTLTEFEKFILEGIFGINNSIQISALKNKFYTHLPKIKKSMYSMVVSDGYFPTSPDKVRKTYAGVFILFIVVGGFLVFGVSGSTSMISGISIIGSGIIGLIFSMFMPRKTRLGAEAHQQILGFKWFLSVTETERIKFHNAPAKNPKIFEEFLPYAMVLRVEKEWADQFKDIFLGDLDWYDGGTTNVLTAAYLANSLGGMSTNVNSAMVSRPNSAGGGTSGFSSGGGFSGGGFGGGGGGSW